MHLLLYGGTFDPIHHAHLLLARAARETLPADLVVFLPAHISPHKQPLPAEASAAPASAAHRLAMLQLALRDAPDLTFDACELHRPAPSYTIDTLLALRAARPRDTFTLLVGQDQLPKLHTWHRIDELLKLTRLAIAPRPQVPMVDLDALAAQLRTAPERFTLLNTPLLAISATAIRRRVREGLPISFFVPPAVERYIAQHKLYRH